MCSIWARAALSDRSEPWRTNHTNRKTVKECKPEPCTIPAWRLREYPAMRRLMCQTRSWRTMPSNMRTNLPIHGRQGRSDNRNGCTACPRSDLGTSRSSWKENRQVTAAISAGERRNVGCQAPKDSPAPSIPRSRLNSWPSSQPCQAARNSSVRCCSV